MLIIIDMKAKARNDKNKVQNVRLIKIEKNKNKCKPLGTVGGSRQIFVYMYER